LGIPAHARSAAPQLLNEPFTFLPSHRHAVSPPPFLIDFSRSRHQPLRVGGDNAPDTHSGLVLDACIWRLKSLNRQRICGHVGRLLSATLHHDFTPLYFSWPPPDPRHVGASLTVLNPPYHSLDACCSLRNDFRFFEVPMSCFPHAAPPSNLMFFFSHPRHVGSTQHRSYCSLSPPPPSWHALLASTFY
jgi:hypothetical protein